MQQPIKIIISGGGTGGHIFPALAIADACKTHFPDSEILFVGAKDKMEMQKVPQAGYPIIGLWIAGIQRKISWQNLLFPIKLMCSLLVSFFILIKYKPHIVIGTGGFASGAVLLMANWLRIPTLIQEQNSFPGITNKVAGKKARKICVAYNGLETFFDAQKLVFTGNPVRQSIANRQEDKATALAHFNLNPEKSTLLVIGGSLGAQKINELIAHNSVFFEKHNLQIIWQCGALYKERYQHLNSKNIQVFDFINRMDFAYQSADFIISRSGASSVSELCLVGKPVIFIPSPNVAEDHQTKNAMAMVKNNAAIMIKESELETTFQYQFENLIQNKEVQKLMSENILKLAKPHATQAILKEIIAIIAQK